MKIVWDTPPFNPGEIEIEGLPPPKEIGRFRFNKFRNYLLSHKNKRVKVFGIKHSCGNKNTNLITIRKAIIINESNEILGAVDHINIKVKEIIPNKCPISFEGIISTYLKQEKVSANKQNLVECDYQIRILSEKIEMIKKFMQTMKQNNQEQIKQKQEKIINIENEIAQSIILTKDIAEEINSLQSSISDYDTLSKKIEKLESIKRQLNDKISKINHEIDFFVDHSICPTCKQDIEKEFKTSSIEEKQKDLVKLKEGLAKLADEMIISTSRLDEILSIKKQIIKENE